MKSNLRLQDTPMARAQCLTLSAEDAVTVAELVDAETCIVRVWRGSAVLDRLARGMAIEFSVADVDSGRATCGDVISAQVVRQGEDVDELRLELGPPRVESVAIGAIPRT